MKLKCSKYPKEKCEHLENKTYDTCLGGCKFNLYQNAGIIYTYDGFKKFSENINKETPITEEVNKLILNDLRNTLITRYIQLEFKDGKILSFEDVEGRSYMYKTYGKLKVKKIKIYNLQCLTVIVDDCDANEYCKKIG